MSLGIAIKGPEGIVLAADSRLTINTKTDGSPQPFHFDNASKLLNFDVEMDPNAEHRFVGAVTYGVGTLELRTAKSFLPEFELTLDPARMTVLEYATSLSDFFLQQWNVLMTDAPPAVSMQFIVGGFDSESPYGSIYLIQIPQAPAPDPRSVGGDFGITWGGQLDIPSRLLRGFDPNLLPLIKQELDLTPAQMDTVKAKLLNLSLAIPYNFLSLQDCVNLAILLLRTTIDAQALTIGKVRGVGGSIDVATITRKEGIRFIQQKQVQGEYYK